jgi:hypothetical protein
LGLGQSSISLLGASVVVVVASAFAARMVANRLSTAPVEDASAAPQNSAV